MFERILVVCTGNICRSPFGEALLKQLFPEKQISSAGTSALVGHAADETAIRVAAKIGFDLQGHKGRQLDEAICRENDLILYMEAMHQQQIAQIDPAATGKSMPFAKWTEKKDIADPYRQSEEYFARIFAQMQRAANMWKEKI